MFSELYGQFAQMFAADDDGPFWLGYVISQTAPAFDDGGSLIPSPTGPWQRDCVVQVDSADTAMRAQEGFVETDRRMIIPTASLSGPLTTDHQIEVRNGPFAGRWSVESVSRNAASSQWVARGRKS
jgi:hypothetical protein